MDKASEAILALKPVTFRYKQELDPEGIPQFGLVAEEVEKVNPDLVARDDNGQALHRALRSGERDVAQRVSQRAPQSRELEATVAQQHKDFETAVAELKGQIQKVSAQLELSKAAPQTVLNNRLNFAAWVETKKVSDLRTWFRRLRRRVVRRNIHGFARLRDRPRLHAPINPFRALLVWAKSKPSILFVRVATVKEQAVQIQKVSAQLELDRLAPQRF